VTDAHVAQVIDVIHAVFRRKGAAAPPPVGPETPLDGSLGLDSLDFAEVAVRLEQAFGFDPFSAGTVNRLRTVADLAALYRR
jgi:acyl carrier protein